MCQYSPITCDYFTFIEPCLVNETKRFFNTCENFEAEANCELKIIKKYYFEENFDPCDDPVPIIENHNECMKSEYVYQLKKFQALNHMKKLLLDFLDYAENGDPDEEYVDMEVFGLSNSEQKRVYLKRIEGFKHCKEIGRKVLKKLQNELEYYQKKEQEGSLAAKLTTDLYRSQSIPAYVIENDINNEMTRIKDEFTKKYEKLFLTKLKCEKLDVRMRTEMIPKITNLETSLMMKRHELEKVKNEITETIKQENLQMKIDDEHEKKLKAVTKEYDKVMEENNNTLHSIEMMKRSIVKTSRNIESIKNDLRDHLVNYTQDAAIFNKVVENHEDTTNVNLCYLKNSTNCEFNIHDAEICILRNKICKMLQEISKSTEFIKALQNDVKFLRNEHQKYFIGHDYMGNTIMSPKIPPNI